MAEVKNLWYCFNEMIHFRSINSKPSKHAQPVYGKIGNHKVQKRLSTEIIELIYSKPRFIETIFHNLNEIQYAQPMDGIFRY